MATKLNDSRNSILPTFVECSDKVAYHGFSYFLGVNGVNLGGLFFQLGLTVVFVGLAALGIFWAIKSGQYDDLDGPAQRILMDDDDPMIPFNETKSSGRRARKVEPNQEKSK